MNLIKNPELLDKFENGDKWYLYFLWYNETLVYIGQSNNIISRINTHRTNKAFNSVTYKVFPSSKEVREAEAENIKHYNPIYNNNPIGIFKHDDYCYSSLSGRVERIEKEMYVKLDDIHYYYSGSILYSIKEVKGVYTFYIDKNKDNVVSYKHIEIYIKDNKLAYRSIDKHIPKPIVKKEYDKMYNNKTLQLTSKLPFGQYKGDKVSFIKAINPSYLRWFIGVYKGTISEELYKWYDS